MNQTKSKGYPRTSRQLQFKLDATPEQVFPLLCPVREYDWIASWRCEVLHTDSGVAEDNCIFRTERPDGSRDTWVVSHYEPPRRIAFVVVHPRIATRMSLRLRETPDGCLLDWEFVVSALEPMPAAELEALAEQRQAVLRGREAELQHYLRHGTRLHG